MTEANPNAPGHPGMPPQWTSSAKNGIGTAVSPQSRVWFTISHGIIDEVYYPNLDQANTRDLGFLVADGSTFFSEEKRDCKHEITQVHKDVPCYYLNSTCKRSRYGITKTVITDPRRDVLLQRGVPPSLPQHWSMPSRYRRSSFETSRSPIFCWCLPRCRGDPSSPMKR